MKSVYILSVFFAIGVVSCKDVDTNSDQSVKVISGATMFNGNGGESVENSVIVVRDDRIDCAGTEGDCGIPDGAETIDATGKFITPGLVDVHSTSFRPASSIAGRMHWI